MAIQPQYIFGTGGDIDASGNNAAPARVFATDNSENIRTTGSNDFVGAGGGDDTIFTGHGRDTINAGTGDDYIDAGGSNDIVVAGDGNDTVDGAGDNDTLVGGNGDDRMIGGDGNDVMWGDNNGGNLDGSVGNDVFVFDMNDGSDKVYDFDVDHDTVELTDGGNYSLTYQGGNTYLHYGSTTAVFFDAELTSDDFTGATLDVL